MSFQWTEVVVVGGIVAGGYVLSRLVRLLLGRLLRRVSGRTRTRLDDAILAAAELPAQTAVLVVALQLALGRLPSIPAAWQPDLNRLFFLAYALVAFVFLYRLITGLMAWYGAEIAHKTETELDDRFLILFRRLALAGLTVVFIVVVLGRFGVEVSALVTTLGIGSLAVALAAQETLGNVFAGFSILTDRPFRIGDRVELLELKTWGDVKEIGLRSTWILTRDNRLVSVPNGVIAKGLIVNYSRPNTMFRVETHVGVAYGTDVEHARQIMIAAIAAEPWVMKEERIEALFLEFGESALIFRVRCWIEHFIETRRIIDRMNTALYRALTEAQIVMPVPRRDVRLLPAPVPAAAPADAQP